MTASKVKGSYWNLNIWAQGNHASSEVAILLLTGGIVVLIYAIFMLAFLPIV
jgi:hypothetical protein